MTLVDFKIIIKIIPEVFDLPVLTNFLLTGPFFIEYSKD